MGRRCSKVSLLDIKSIIIKAVKLALRGGLESGDEEMLLARGNVRPRPGPGIPGSPGENDKRGGCRIGKLFKTREREEQIYN